MINGDIVVVIEVRACCVFCVAFWLVWGFLLVPPVVVLLSGEDGTF